VNQENRNRGNGISEIEGKAARVAASERGQRVSFKQEILLLFMDYGFQIVSSFPTFLILMSVLVDKNTRLVVQGITAVRVHFTPGSAWSTAPTWLRRHAGKGGQMFDGKVPVFDTVWEARQKTGCNASMVFVPAPAAADSILEAVDAGVSW